MQYWLVKQEPESYSWSDFVKDGKTAWTGVRNFSARNNLRAMKNGDLVFYYHSNTGKDIVGVAKVVREAYADPTATREDGDWSSVDIAPVKPLQKPVTLEQIKADSLLQDMKLVRQSRLSVSPVTKTQFERILKLSETAPRDLGLLTVILFAALCLFGCQMMPPREPGPFRKSDLVEITKLDPEIRLDIRYATTNNFLHRPVYKQARAFLQRPAAVGVVRAHHALKSKGYGLLIFDGYRPWSVTKLFWKSASEEERKIEFVANPKKGSRHNRGCAVDLTLYELSTGKEVFMPSTYDEFSDRAYPDYEGGSAEARALRDLLRQTMESEGFTVYKAEWWHFDYNPWKEYPILNVPFEKLDR